MSFPPARRLAFRNKVSELLDGFTAIKVYAPNEEFTTPSPSSVPGSPTVYGAWAVEEDEAEQFTFGCTRVTGELSLWVWAQKGTSDETIQAHHDALAEVFRTANEDSIDFMPSRSGDAFTEGEFFAEELVIPYQRFEAA